MEFEENRELASSQEEQAKKDLRMKPSVDAETGKTETGPAQESLVQVDEIVEEKEMSEEELAELETKRAQLQALLKQNRTSNMILLVLIAIYVLSLFFFNNWIVVILLIIPMIGLVIWDNRRLKQIRRLQVQIQKTKDGPMIQEAITSLNELSKEYTVLDDVDLDGVLLNHVILSPYGLAEVSEEDETGLLRQTLDLAEDVPVLWISSDESILAQQRQILSLREPVLDEQQIFAMLYKLSGISK